MLKQYILDHTVFTTCKLEVSHEWFMVDFFLESVQSKILRVLKCLDSSEEFSLHPPLKEN